MSEFVLMPGNFLKVDVNRDVPDQSSAGTDEVYVFHVWRWVPVVVSALLDHTVVITGHANTALLDVVDLAEIPNTQQ